jgi:hypothetical protein
MLSKARYLEGPLWVNNGLYRQPCHTSAHRREADVNDAKAEVAVGMSAVGGKADGLAWASESPSLANSGYFTSAMRASLALGGII